MCSVGDRKGILHNEVKNIMKLNLKIKYFKEIFRFETLENISLKSQMYIISKTQLRTSF
jgi:hypothetical protein